jgi:hypothetical protein
MTHQIKEQESLPKSGESKAPEEPRPPKAVSVEDQVGSSVSIELELGSDGRPLHEPEGNIFPANSHELDKSGLQREMTSRFQDRPLLLEDLKELGMAGDLSDDGQYLTMPFEDVHRLVTTMRMAEVILNERVQKSRKVKIARIKTQLELDAEHCPNMSALLAELERAKQALTQKHSFHSIGAFEAYAQDFKGNILLETMMIARAVTWLAKLSIDPNAETRRGCSMKFCRTNRRF